MKIKLINFFLFVLHGIDQKIRYQGRFGVFPVKIMDHITTHILKYLVTVMGIKSIYKLGESGVNRFLTLTCHSTDLNFIRKICRTDEILKGTSDREKVAILIDNALVRSGEKQRFGEIMRIYKDANGKNVSVPLPLQDPENINKIRADFGLSKTIEERVRWANEQFKNMRVPN